MDAVVFQGNAIPYTTVEGVHYIAVKPICEAIGIRHDTALEVIKNNEILGQLYGLRRITGADGKTYEMASLPLSHLNGWLFMIDVNRVGEQAREKLLAYQERCFAVLHEHFFGSQQAHEEARTLHYEILRAEAELKEARLAHKNSDTAQRVKSAKDALMLLQARQTEINSERYGDTLELFSPTV